MDQLHLYGTLCRKSGHQKAVNFITAEPKEYIPRKLKCQLVYRKLEKVKGLSQEQYAAVVKKYAMLGQTYSLLNKFHRIVSSKKEANWMSGL